MPYEFNTLVAVELNGQIVCIGRVVSDDVALRHSSDRTSSSNTRPQSSTTS